MQSFPIPNIVMSEYRRLLISSKRIEDSLQNNNLIKLTTKEKHYITRVLRLRDDDQLAVIDGLGRLWNANLVNNDYLVLTTNAFNPIESSSRPEIQTCLAIVMPKYGMDDVIRMSCEIGIDIIQPLVSNRSVVTHLSSQRFSRWNVILNESVEQSERLWRPQLRELICFSNWLEHSFQGMLVTIGTTRTDKAQPFELLLEKTSTDVDEIWTAIGPEGGWTDDEIELAEKHHCINITMGNSILRSSTAAVVSTQIMSSWRTLNV
ncbi:16S rRNA (uracil(1498)-N(3))-methyltransferase [Prochlorococcus sp. MIT 0603]|uniref:16S rRNA (uracil(1498)-N(3))-methyltransferase n=2 Tax=Prochlorococcus TaxID=1218 RepID=UPI0019D335F5|nr:16S rRNA (uracil(1498)-N(3))-methyltransferase [Prochlorococcus sp. MIT 0603]